jgi:hypothetical protein
MAALRRAGTVLWCVVTTYDVLVGVTTTDPGTWAANLLALVFFGVMSWRFFAPSLTVAPSPLVVFTAAGAIAVSGLTFI